MARQYFEDLVTNESLDAIVAGLDLSPRNNVLSICGSGDQAFAILEKAKEVTLVDSRENQIQYALNRRKMLIEKDFEGFVNPGKAPTDSKDSDCLIEKIEYFSPTRLNKISKKVKNPESLKVKIGNIYSIDLQNEKFDRIYLSNSIGYGSNTLNFDLTDKRLSSIAPSLATDGLIYVTDGMQVLARSRIDGNSRILDHIGLKVNEKLTRKAQKLQFKAKSREYANYWLPVVLEKVENN